MALEIFARAHAVVDAVFGFDAGHALEFVEDRRPDDGGLVVARLWCGDRKFVDIREQRREEIAATESFVAGVESRMGVGHLLEEGRAFRRHREVLARQSHEKHLLERAHPGVEQPHHFDVTASSALWNPDRHTIERTGEQCQRGEIAIDRRQRLERGEDLVYEVVGSLFDGLLGAAGVVLRRPLQVEPVVQQSTERFGFVLDVACSELL
nr:hypothetical protein [Halorubrum sp. SD626R]